MRSTPLSRGLGYLSLVVMIVVIGVPLYWMLTGSLKTTQQIVTFPPVWLPPAPRWQNFSDAWTSAPFGNFYVNSIITTAAASIAKLFNAVLCAYALAYLRF